MYRGSNFFGLGTSFERWEAVILEQVMVSFDKQKS